MKERKLIKRKKFDEVLIKYIEENKPEFIEMSMMIDMLERARGARYGYDEIRKRVYTHIMIDKISKRNKYYEFSYDNKKKIFTYEKKESYAEIYSGSSEKLLEDDSNLKVEYKPLDQKVTTTKTTTTTTTTETTTVEETVPVVPNVSIEVTQYNDHVNILMETKSGELISDLCQVIFPDGHSKMVDDLKDILSVKVKYPKVYYNVINIDSMSIYNIDSLYNMLFKHRKTPWIVYGSKDSVIPILNGITSNGFNPLTLNNTICNNGFCNGKYCPKKDKDNIVAFMLYPKNRWICDAVNECINSVPSPEPIIKEVIKEVPVIKEVIKEVPAKIDLESIKEQIKNEIREEVKQDLAKSLVSMIMNLK